MPTTSMDQVIDVPGISHQGLTIKIVYREKEWEYQWSSKAI
jgi:hypothetical protein